MQNGIIINGVKYKAVETQSLDGCDGCAFVGGLRGKCMRRCPCLAFHPKDVIFKKLKDQEK